MNRYEIISELGQGSTGVVYRAHDTLLDRSVALKAIQLNDGHKVALAEARAAARISHPNVVIVHDVMEVDGQALIAMELLEGPTLRDVLVQQGSFPLDTAVQIGRQIAASLAAAHTRCVVHSDIKPDNIFLMPNGRLVVTDFGLAGPDIHGGTPGYMAPEQWRDEVAQPQSDVFSWACVVAECLSGEPPFGLDPLEAESRTLYDAPALTAAPPLSDLLFECLEKDPRRRPADGTVLAARLEAALSASSISGPAPATVADPFRGQRAPSGPARVPSFDQAPRGGAVRLVVYPPEGGTWYLDLAIDDQVEVGREAEVTLPDPLASRRHAHLRCTPTGVLVTDLGSLNGTWCNGRQIEQGQADIGDVLTVGSTVIRVEVPT